MFERRNSLKWQGVAKRIDRWSRLSIFAFILWLAVLFNVRVDEGCRDEGV